MIKNVITIEAKATVREAVTIMNEHEMGCLVIAQDGHILSKMQNNVEA